MCYKAGSIPRRDVHNRPPFFHLPSHTEMGVTYLGHGVNFPVANAGDIRASGATFPVLGFILLLLRAAAYRHANHKPGLADLFSWIAWVRSLPCCPFDRRWHKLTTDIALPSCHGRCVSLE